MRRHRWSGLRGLIVALALYAGTPALAGDGATRFFSDATIVETNDTRVIPFRLDAPAARDRVLTTRVTGDARVEIVQPALVLEGETIGFLRVRGQQSGKTSITVDGTALDVEVRPAERRLARDQRPRIIGPTDGAVIWGDVVTVGVDIRETPADTHDGALSDVRLRTSLGQEIEPIGDTRLTTLPLRALAFEVPLAGTTASSVELVPIARRGELEITGVPIRVRIVHPEADDLLVVEAETRFEGERPDRFRDARTNVGRDRAASGGRYFVNNSMTPAVCMGVDVEEPGWYQLIVTARGTRAQGALPTVGVVIDNGNQSTTNGPILHDGWHRTTIGLPFPLEAGAHVVTPTFANDFFVASRADRNLHLDRLELARVANLDADDGAGMASMMMMAAGGMGMMGMGDDDASAGLIDDPHGTRASALRLGLERPLDGDVIPGVLEVRSRAWWPEPESRPAPLVSLLINGELAMTQRSGSPRFWADASMFAPGANTIQLIAELPSGLATATPVQTMHYPAEAARDRVGERHHRRFSIHEPGWDDATRASLLANNHPSERVAAALVSEGELTLDLPADVAGRFMLFIECRGDHFQGAPILVAALRDGDDEERELGRIEPQGGWNTRPVDEITLEPGPKRLVLRFINDRFEAAVGDRNVFVQAIALAELPPAEDVDPPVVEIRYPPDDHATWMADAIVAEASDNLSLNNAELLVDGMKTGFVVNLNAKPGRFVLPLLLRSLEPGPHTVAVRVSDVAGNSTLSEMRTIEIAPDEPDEPTTYARAIRLLNRFAYGPDQRSLASILIEGERAWLERQLTASFDEPGDAAALAGGFPYFVNRSPYEITSRATSHLLLTPNPARARFVMWAGNHFSTWMRKTGGELKWDEHIALSRLGPARFEQLLRCSAESPAMLVYLDQSASFAGQLNENYARELLELHTVGVDAGYAQEDVTHLARLLTGWSVSLEGDGRGGGAEARRYETRFDPVLNDGEEADIFGARFDAARGAARYDRVLLALEVLAAHPSTARFIAHKLASHYAAHPPPDDLVDELVDVYHRTGGDLVAMLLAIAVRPEDWEDRLATPLDYGIRLGRTANHYQPWRIREFMARSGALVFDRPTPDGYPEEDVAYADSNALAQRWRLAQDANWALAAFVPGQWQSPRGLPEQAWAQRVVDVLAVRLTGSVLGKASNEAAVELLRQSEGQPYERVRTMAAFVAQLPEASVR